MCGQNINSTLFYLDCDVGTKTDVKCQSGMNVTTTKVCEITPQGWCSCRTSTSYNSGICLQCSKYLHFYRIIELNQSYTCIKWRRQDFLRGGRPGHLKAMTHPPQGVRGRVEHPPGGCEVSFCKTIQSIRK